MLIDPQLMQAVSDGNEAVAEKRFKKLGFKTERLDRGGPRKRPDFLVHDSRGPLLVAEVKTIHSAGYLRDHNVHVSTLDPRLAEIEGFSIDVDFHEEKLVEATEQRSHLVEDRPALAGLPFVVVLFSDVHADHFQLMPTAMEAFPEISGLLKIERDHAREKVIKGMSTPEMERRILTDDMRGLPPPSKEFLLLQNECAGVRLPAHFVDQCVVVSEDLVST